MNKQYARTGSITVANPAAAVTVELGFQASYVRAWNVNNLTSYEWFSGMSAGTSLDNANHADTQNSVNAAGSITVTSNSVTFGLDICDTASDVVRWLAIR